MLGRLVKAIRGQAESESAPLSVPDKRFCYIDWHGDSRTLRMEYGDTPSPMVSAQVPSKSPFTEDDLRNLLKKLKAEGWREYISSPNAEGRTHFLVFPSAPDYGKRESLLSFATTIGAEDRMPQRLGWYNLDKKNESLLGSNAWQTNYEDTLKAVKKGSWELVREEDFPHYGVNSKRRIHLRFYRR